jgi:hypothetical protein
MCARHEGIFEGHSFDSSCCPQISDLLSRHVTVGRPDATDVTLPEFLTIFAELEERDVGINMV